MQSKLLDGDTSGNAARTFALIFDSGDDVVSTLEAFAAEKHVTAAHLTAIGAFRTVALGYFDWELKDYRRLEFDEQMEVLSLIGDIAMKDAKPKLHAHVVLGRSDGSTRGGHLLEATVRPTLEVILFDTPRHLQRRYDAESGLALINLDG